MNFIHHAYLALLIHYILTSSFIQQGVLKHNPIAELHSIYGPNPGPLDEVTFWNRYLDKLRSIDKQLASPVAIDIAMNLKRADSTFSASLATVRKEIIKVYFAFLLNDSLHMSGCTFPCATTHV